MKINFCFLYFFLFLLTRQVGYGQTIPTYFKEVAPIINENCVECHRPGGLGPFSLTDFEAVKSKIKTIIAVTKSGYMPPWQADPYFRSFKNERFLDSTAIELIEKWYLTGTKKGRRKDLSITQNISRQKRTADLILPMNKAYVLSDKSIEDYRFFNLPTNLPEDTYLKSVEFIPGNKRVVHHSRIMIDTTNQIRGIDGLSEYDPKALEYQKHPLADEFLYGWVPGNLPVSYPSGTGKKIFKNSDLILNIHYAPTSKTEMDSSLIKLYFTKEKVKEEIKVLTIREGDISNQPFYIPANTKPTFYVSYNLKQSVNMVSVMPHMHFIGDSFKALAVTPSGDAIPIIKIDKWDFNWQSTYLFEKPQFLPKGTIILITATYDNTSSNPENPNIPPKDIGYGWGSTDEMMNFIIYYY
ncbi:MAG: hypothetical protein EBY37_03540 [Flavobacteriia bacterium]|nr:hypothetical protein [Flavobacteriia bacterium]